MLIAGFVCLGFFAYHVTKKQLCCYPGRPIKTPGRILERPLAVFLYENKDQDKHHALPITIPLSADAHADDVIE